MRSAGDCPDNLSQQSEIDQDSFELKVSVFTAMEAKSAAALQRRARGSASRRYLGYWVVWTGTRALGR